jgi:hypothetical protein
MLVECSPLPVTVTPNGAPRVPLNGRSRGRRIPFNGPKWHTARLSGYLLMGQFGPAQTVRAVVQNSGGPAGGLPGGPPRWASPVGLPGGPPRWASPEALPEASRWASPVGLPGGPPRWASPEALPEALSGGPPRWASPVGLPGGPAGGLPGGPPRWASPEALPEASRWASPVGLPGGPPRWASPEALPEALSGGPQIGPTESVKSDAEIG